MYRILIIDDEDAILFILASALIKYGYEVKTAANGKQGIEAFAKERFGLVITDICMPGIDGMEVLRHVRNSQKSYTPVIGISGTPWLLRKTDFDAVLSKPFSIKEMCRMVELLLPDPRKSASGG